MWEISQRYKVAILMPLYSGDTPSAFGLAVRSLFRQSLKSDIYVVVDGMIGPDLERILNNISDRIKIIKIKENIGLARALNYALSRIRITDYDFIARMDADDFAISSRISKQILYMDKNGLDVCGSNYICFDGSRNRKRILLPSNLHEMKSRILVMSPICHPSVIFRSHVLQSERYPENTILQEDYRFWIKLIKKGYVLGNIQEFLLYFRYSNATKARRTDIKKLSSDIRDRFTALSIYSGSRVTGTLIIFVRFIFILLFRGQYLSLLEYRNKFVKKREK